MELITKTTLLVNPLLKPQHLQFYHEISARQASRLMEYYRDVTQKKKPTFLDFYKLTGAFPDKKFKPIWISLSVPKTTLLDNLDVIGHSIS